MLQVGLPAKSGVSGVVLVVVPNVVGFATWSPPLDSIGNSARGVMFAEELGKVYDFHRFNTASEKKDPRYQNYEEKSVHLVKLLFAASYGDKMALERAFLSGMNMNMGDYDNRTALHLACSEDHLACVKYLVETCKVDLHVKDRWGFTPLEEAHKFNRSKTIAYLKKQSVSKRSVFEVPTIEINETLHEEAAICSDNIQLKEPCIEEAVTMLIGLHTEPKHIS